MTRLEMKNCNIILREELIAGKETLPSNRSQQIEQTSFTNSPLEKAFEKQTKTIKG